MTQGKPEARTKWLSFRCPSCRTELRIKAAYASMRGRCPECGSRIEALRPAAAATPRQPPRGQPDDLVPIEDEWPEPAQVKDEVQPGAYELAAQPPSWPEPPAPPPLRGQGYDLATGNLPAPPPPSVELNATPFAVEAPASVPTRPSSLIDYQKELDLLHQPPPPPPPFPLWSGLYTFPWRKRNVGVWFYLGLNLSLLAVILTTFALLIEIGGVAMIGIPLLLPVMGFIFFWSGIYASGCFLAVVEDTSAGNDEVTWPRDGGLVDGLGKFVFFLWLGGCGLAPVWIFWVAHGGVTATNDFSWVVAVLPGVLLFPIQLLSVLTAGSWWSLIDLRIVGGLLTKPRALFLMCLPPVALITPCIWIAQLIVVRANFPVAIVAGFIWSAFTLIYARILGRTGWLLTGIGLGAKAIRKTPRRRKLEVGQSGWGEGPDESDSV
jgi:hypothetical protein